MLKFPSTKAEKKEYSRRMQNAPTPAEGRFGRRLEAAAIPFKFQQCLGFYIADFFLTDRLVAVEIDGGYHDEPQQRERDENRDRFLRQCGVITYRIRNEEVESWPVERLLLIQVKSRSTYLSVMGRIGSLKEQTLKRDGRNRPSLPERRKIRAMFGLDPQAEVTPAQIEQYRQTLP